MKAAAAPQPAADFASAAMLRVLAHGMRALGLNPSPGLHAPARPGATVPLDAKRELVAAALAQGGIGCLPLLGRGLQRCAHEPTHSALVSARDAADLFTRWARLERYIHSRHRTEVVALTDRSARIRHLARPGCPPPLAAEDLVVLGVLAALLQAMGATAVTAHIGAVAVYPEPEHAALAVLAQQGRTAAWSFGWAPAPVGPNLPPSSGPAALKPTAPPEWPHHAQHSFTALCQRLMNPLSLPALARLLNEAPRSLQRHFSRAGLSYSGLLAEARCRSAACWLMHTDTPIAEVGLLSGYADQAHFTRDFHRRVGLTPLRYRAGFSASSSNAVSHKRVSNSSW